MNHQLIKKILKILSMVAFVGIIGYQLYNIIVNGGSKSNNENNNDIEPELETTEEGYDGDLVPVTPTQAYNESYNGYKGQKPSSYPSDVPVTSEQ